MSLLETHHHGHHIQGSRIPDHIKKCGILILVDDSVMDHIDHNFILLKKKLDLYMKELNEIYQRTILAMSPHNNIFLKINHVKYWKEFLPGCNDGNVC